MSFTNKRQDMGAGHGFAALAERVLWFWFGPPAADGTTPARAAWFAADPAFDAACANQFAEVCREALDGRLAPLGDTAEGALALILLLDQFPRAIYRGTASAFAGDAAARAVAAAAIGRRYDLAMAPVHRLFFYLPFGHSEAIADQDRACALIAELGNAGWLRHAEQQRAIIARFGRFPNRNRILGRPSSPEELAFLAAAERPC